jgi:outer membrane protein OmpU
MGATFETRGKTMKKILLATAALSAMTGFAAAEGVTVTGTARMGLIYDGDDTLMTSRVRVKFEMMGTTDGGLEFGASVRNDQSGQGNDANNDSNVYIKGAFGKLTFGDNDSAANALVGHVSGVGLTGLGDWNELRYLGQEDTSALYEYSSGALTFAVSVGQLEGGEGEAGDATRDAISIAAKYSTDTFSVALGVEDGDLVDGGVVVAPGVTHIALGGSATFGAATVKAVISDTDVDGDDTQFAVSVDYVAGAGTYTLFVTEEGEVNNFGLGASYDLGGGASVKAGIVRVDGDNGGLSDTIGDTGRNETIADVGISMSF